MSVEYLIGTAFKIVYNFVRENPIIVLFIVLCIYYVYTKLYKQKPMEVKK